MAKKKTNSKTTVEELLGDTWLARLDLYPLFARVVTRENKDTHVTKLIPLPALADVFNNLQTGTGALPPNTLAMARHGRKVKLTIYVPPDTYKIRTEAYTYTLPLPALVFVGMDGGYSMYALREASTWPDAHTQLYYPPLTNIMKGGSVCLGTVRVPKCGPKTIWDAFKQIMESFFTAHAVSDRCQSHDSIYDLWSELDGADVFPVDELVPMKKRLQEVIG